MATSIAFAVVVVVLLLFWGPAALHSLEERARKQRGFCGPGAVYTVGGPKTAINRPADTLTHSINRAVYVRAASSD
jgi:hypothetical protein